MAGKIGCSQKAGDGQAGYCQTLYGAANVLKKTGRIGANLRWKKAPAVIWPLAPFYLPEMCVHQIAEDGKYPVSQATAPAENFCLTAHPRTDVAAHLSQRHSRGVEVR
jgi:hypothetical protein